MIRRLALSLVLGLMLIGTQASAVFGAANEESSNCLAQFTSNQEPGGVAESVTSNLAQAHPFGIVVISFTARMQAPCFEEE